MPFPAVDLDTAHKLLTQPGSPFEIVEREIHGVSQKVWKNAPPTLRDVFLMSRAHGDKTFLVHEGDRATYEAFARATLALARELQKEGVRKGDRVAVAMRNLPEWPAAFFAASLVGAIVTPLNAWGTGGELEYGLADSGAVVAILDGERLERLLPHFDALPDLRRAFVARSSTTSLNARVRSLESVLGGVSDWAQLPSGAMPDVSLEPEDDATLFYTSGTTGKPKGALGTQRNSCTTVMAGPFSRARVFMRRGEPLPAPDPNAPQRAFLVSIPFFHTTGCQAILIPSMTVGGKLVTMRKWDVDAALELIERERITHAGGVPTVAWQIIEHPNFARHDLSSLESLSYGGAPAAAELVRGIVRTLPQSAPGTGWGMTETSATFTHHQAEDYVARPWSCGPALPICEISIRDEEGRVLPIDAVGELWVKGPNVVKEYWNKPEATRETFVEGWLRTGDIARVDAEGFCEIVDRRKDMLIRGGENIYCIEVENALYEHPAVIDAGVVGIPHRTFGEEPAAIVSLKAGEAASEAELRAFVAARLAAFKVPVRILFLADLLPRNPNGKLRKDALRDMFV